MSMGSSAKSGLAPSCFQPLIDAMQRPACLLGLDLAILAANARYAALHGRNVAGCIGRPILEVIADRLDREALLRAKELFAEVLDGRPCSIREESRGEFVSVTVSPLLDQDGQPTALLVSIEDVTEITRAGASLANERERFAKAMEMADVGVWEADLETGANRWSAITWQLYGLSPAEHAEASTALWIETLHPDDKEAIIASVQQAVDRLEPVDFEYRILLADGTIRWLQARGQPLHSNDGSSSFYMGIVIDITQRKLVEGEELKHRRHMDYAMEKTHIGFWDLNTDDSTAERTLEHARIFGYDAADTPWSLDRFLEHLDPRDRNRVESLVRKSIAEERDYTFECRIIVKGKPRWIAVSGGFYTDPVDGDRHVLGVAQDITMRKEGEEARERLQAELLHSQKQELLGQLVGGIAHDFNNHLTGILGYSELLLEQIHEPPSAVQSLQYINQAARRSSDLTRQLLAFARKQRIKPETLDLNQQIRELLPMIKRIVDGAISFRLDLSPTTPMVSIDPSQVDQLLANLCINARDAIAEQGTITIATRTITIASRSAKDGLFLPPGSYVRLQIADTGKGIEEDDLPQIFEPFFTTKQSGKGTGLGLSTVYGIVKQNKGSITCSSELGVGSVFTIYLPLVKPDAQKPAALQSDHPDPGAALKPRTILLVEDEPDVLRLVDHLLSEHGFRVITAASGQEAIVQEAAEKGTIELLLTDIRMPDINGFWLARLLLPRRPGMRVLYMSGYADWSSAEQPARGERLNFIAKPFTIKNLLRAVDKALASPPPPAAD